MNFRLTAPVWATILANLIPPVMLALGLWNVTDMLVLYWAETAVVGFFNVLAIFAAGAPGPRCAKRLTAQALKNGEGMAVLARVVDEYGFFGKLLVALISLLPFVLLMILQGMTLYLLFLGPQADFAAVLWNVRWCLAALFGSRAVSFAMDYIASGEYRRTRAEALMDRYAPRMFIIQVALMLGGGICRNAKMWPVMIGFVAAKLLMDLRPEGGYIGGPARKTS